MEEDIFKDFINRRNLSQNTIYAYRDSLQLYCKFQQKSLKNLIIEAETEETQGIRWKDRKLKKRLINYREYLIDNYSKKSVKTHLGRVLTFYKHYEIEIHQLPDYSEKNMSDYKPITFRDLPDRDVLKRALKISNPLMRAIILFGSSSGCARREILNLTIGDFVQATGEYHNESNIYGVMDRLKDRADIIPCFELERQKTRKFYHTFCTPEATTEIINYLLTRENLKDDDELFKANKDYLNIQFQEINNKLGLGKVGKYNRFRSHMLRKFHASQLYNDGVSMDVVDSLQGRSKDTTHSSYFMEDTRKLKEVYIEHMGCLTINLDVNNLDIKSPEYIQLENENKELEKQVEDNNELLEDILSRLNTLENK